MLPGFLVIADDASTLNEIMADVYKNLLLDEIVFN